MQDLRQAYLHIDLSAVSHSLSRLILRRDTLLERPSKAPTGHMYLQKNRDTARRHNIIKSRIPNFNQYMVPGIKAGLIMRYGRLALKAAEGQSLQKTVSTAKTAKPIVSTRIINFKR
jgi:hypothetical protein